MSSLQCQSAYFLLPPFGLKGRLAMVPAPSTHPVFADHRYFLPDTTYLTRPYAYLAKHASDYWPPVISLSALSCPILSIVCPNRSFLRPWVR